jgi:hypothetical protein
MVLDRVQHLQACDPDLTRCGTCCRARLLRYPVVETATIPSARVAGGDRGDETRRQSEFV